MDSSSKKYSEFDQLVNNLDVGIFRYVEGNSETRFLFVNSVLCRMLGYLERELLKQPVDDIFKDKQVLRSLEEKALAADKAYQENLELKAKNQRALLCAVTIVAVREGKKEPKHFDVIVRSLVQEKQVEKDI